MVTDELMLKLGIDQSQVSPGLEDFKQKVAGATGHGKRQFWELHNEGRSFKQMLNEISSTCPELGMALRFALNPIVGILTAATLGIKAFIDKQKEAIENAEKLAKAAAKMQVASIEASASLDPQKLRMEASLAALKERAGKTVSDFLPEAEVYQKKIYGAVLDMESWNKPTTVGTPGGSMVSGGPEAPADLLTKEAIMARATAMRDQAVADFKKAAEAKFFYDETEKMDKQLLEWDKQNLQNEEKWAKEKEARREKQEKAQEALTKAWEDYAKKVGDDALKVKRGVQGIEDRYKPDIDKLAAQGTWTRNRVSGQWNWRPTGLAQEAQYIKGLERYAENQVLSGDVAGARETIFGKGGVTELRTALEKAGILKRDFSEILADAMTANGALKVYVDGGAE